MIGGAGQTAKLDAHAVRAAVADRGALLGRQRLTNTYPSAVWPNPVEQRHWGYTHSTQIVRELMQDRMYPLTLDGLDDAMRTLNRKV